MNVSPFQTYRYFFPREKIFYLIYFIFISFDTEIHLNITQKKVYIIICIKPIAIKKRYKKQVFFIEKIFKIKEILKN